jgi:hypothetical protein
VSYDLYLYSAPPGADPDAHLDALMEAEEPADGAAKGLAAQLLKALPEDLRPVAERFDEVVVLAEGIATVDFSPGYAALEISYGVPLAPDQFLAMVEGVGRAGAAIGHDLAHDPQLGRLVVLGDPGERQAMVAKWNEGLAIVAQLRAEAEAEEQSPQRAKRWWRRR